MLIEQIPLQSLIVNPANDRHGELADEAAAIRWLLEKHEHHMRHLARDIVTEGKLYELPLVGPKGDDYLVFDGNRRVTCLKILADPSRASTPELQAFFASESHRWKSERSDGVTCQVEHNREDIDEILYRRHTGSQSGIGQRQWDDTAKDNFIARTGKKLKINVAEEIERNCWKLVFWTDLVKFRDPPQTDCSPMTVSAIGSALLFATSNWNSRTTLTRHLRHLRGSQVIL